jgi:hypothetical protein
MNSLLETSVFNALPCQYCPVSVWELPQAFCLALLVIVSPDFTSKTADAVLFLTKIHAHSDFSQ